MQNFGVKEISFAERPEQGLLDRLGGRPAMILAFDIETHGWPACEDRKGHFGQFGWWTLKPAETLRYSRIVSLGWVIAPPDPQAQEVVKSSFILPNNFQMEEKATMFHGIAQTKLLTEGRSLAEVMQEFMTDVREACKGDCRLVAHQLEFDAGVIQEELRRLGFESLRAEWERCVRQHGYCTMNPEVGRWLRLCHGEQLSSPHAPHVLGAGATLRKLQFQADRTFQPHVAEEDAKMARLIFMGLLERTRRWLVGDSTV